MIGVIDLGIGNVKSIINMLGFLGVDARACNCADSINAADRLILPGVGHFDFAMARLDRLGLISILNKRVRLDARPILGICLGMQLLTRRSEEGDCPGLGWIDAETVAFDRSRMTPSLPLPHMSWTQARVLKRNPLLSSSEIEAKFYHAHSYHLSCDADHIVIVDAEYGYRFPAAIQNGNILGVQFHPEKSHRYGLNLLKNFSAWDGK